MIEEISEVTCACEEYEAEPGESVDMDELRQSMAEINAEVKNIIGRSYRKLVLAIQGDKAYAGLPPKGKTKPSFVTQPHHRKRRR